MSKKEITQYIEILKKRIEENKPSLNTLGKIPKKLYVKIGAVIVPFIDELSEKEDRDARKYYQDRRPMLFQIKYFFDSAENLKEYYLQDYDKTLDELVKVYVRPDLHEIISNSHIDYLKRVDYFKKGYIQMEEGRRIGKALLRMLYPYKEESIEGTVKIIYAYEEALTHHIWSTFDPYMYLDKERDKWEKLLNRFIEDGKIKKEKVFAAILRMEVSGDNLSAVGSSYRQSEIGVISWYFKVMKSMKPTKAELMKLQDRLLEILDSPLPGAKNTTLSFVKHIAGESTFKVDVFLAKAGKSLPTDKLTQVKAILSILALIVKKHPKFASKAVAVAEKSLGNKDKKVQVAIKGFLEKYADQSTVAAATAKLKKQNKPKKLTADDLGGWTEAELKKISQLLLSVDNSSVEIAFSLLENRAFPKILISEVFAVYKLMETEKLSEAAAKILKANASDAVIEKMDSQLALWASEYGPTEKTVKKNIHTYAKDNELDGLKIAQALYKKSGVGISYLLDESTGEKQKEIFKNFMNGTTLKLTGVALTKIPAVIFEFPELTVVDLSDNKIGGIPTKISTLKNLRVLKLDNNNLKTIHKNIATLTNLEELYLTNNKMKAGIPAHLFELTNLKKLDLTNCQDQHEVYELPMSILNLKKLELFRLDYKDAYRDHDSYSNYPQIKEVTGNPINTEPSAIAEAAVDQGDLSPTAYVFKHGDTKLKKKVLDYFYDKSTKTMDFRGQYIAELPKEILDYDIEVLNLNRCGMGNGRSYADVKKVDARELQKTAYITKMTNLKELNLEMNRLTDLSDLSGLIKLRKLFIGDMSIRKIFDFSSLTNLEELKLGSLDLSEIPAGIFKLTNLTHLNLNSVMERRKKEVNLKDFEGLKHLKRLKKFVIDKYQFKDRTEHEKLKTLLPEGCVFSEY